MAHVQRLKFASLVSELLVVDLGSKYSFIKESDDLLIYDSGFIK